MAGDYWGNTYWLTSYFGEYFQAGEAPAGAISGSFEGGASFSATISVATAPSTTQSGVRRLEASVKHSWNIDRVSEMLGSVRLLLGHVEKEAAKPEPKKVEIPPILVEAATVVAPKKKKTQTLDFIPVIRVSLADLDTTALLSELRSIEARLERLKRLEQAKAAKREAEQDDDNAAFILLGIPSPKKPPQGIDIHDDDLAALLLAA